MYCPCCGTEEGWGLPRVTSADRRLLWAGALGRLAVVAMSVQAFRFALDLKAGALGRLAMLAMRSGPVEVALATTERSRR